MRTLLFLILTMFSASAFAFRLTPMVVRFLPSGQGATQVLTLENSGNEKIPIQIEAFQRKHLENGEEKREKTDLFTIYPEQLTLLPGEKRNVRVTWGGRTDSSEELAFRLIATQLPVAFREKNTSIQQSKANLSFMLQYVASAYVAPSSARPKVTVKGVKVTGDGLAEVMVANEGAAHQVLSSTEVTVLSDDGKEVGVLKKREELESINLLAGETRRLKVPRSGLKAGEYTARLKVQENTD